MWDRFPLVRHWYHLHPLILHPYLRNSRDGRKTAGHLLLLLRMDSEVSLAANSSQRYAKTAFSKWWKYLRHPWIGPQTIIFYHAVSVSTAPILLGEYCINQFLARQHLSRNWFWQTYFTILFSCLHKGRETRLASGRFSCPMASMSSTCAGFVFLGANLRISLSVLSLNERRRIFGSLAHYVLSPLHRFVQAQSKPSDLLEYLADFYFNTGVLRVNEGVKN